LDQKIAQPLTPTFNDSGLSLGPGISQSPSPPNGTSSPNGTASSGRSAQGASGFPASLSLYLNSQFVGELTSVERGDTVAQVVTINQAKHLGTVKPEAITIKFGLASVSKELYAWLADTLAGTATPVDGSISAESHHQEVSHLTFSKATITEIQFPALDAASKTGLVITVTLQPQSTSRTFCANAVFPGSVPLCNFKVEIPSLECDRVHRVSVLVFRQNATAPAIGAQRDPGFVAQQYSPIVPNLVLTFPSADVATYQTWFESFVLKGNCGANQEKQGSLRYLNARLEELFSINFSHLGIVRLGQEGPQGPEVVPLCRVEMYCGGMTLSPGPKLGQTRPAGLMGSR
jgi:hypothetical protein